MFGFHLFEKHRKNYETSDIPICPYCKNHMKYYENDIKKENPYCDCGVLFESHCGNTEFSSAEY
jgi:hypothetical protein